MFRRKTFIQTEFLKENWQQDARGGMCGQSKRFCGDVLKAALRKNTSNENLHLSQDIKIFHPYASSLKAQPIYRHTHLELSYLS